MSLGEAETRSLVSQTISQGFSLIFEASLSIFEGDLLHLTTRVFNFTVEFKNNRYHLVYLGGKKKKTTA
jgi:hypothetical protein